tara:strand:+ start:1119 stop:1646 length:528 start_codon:yes stop_codon:yes gene_type:complete
LIYDLANSSPQIDDDVFVADNAIIIGSVTISARASIWYSTVLRGDNDIIEIGERSNVQDGTVIHVDQGIPTTIGKNVSIGHNCMLHGCRIGDGSLIGIGTIILDHARVGAQSLVGANSLITEGKTFPDRSLILGSPAKVIRELTDDEIAKISDNATIYVTKADFYHSKLKIKGNR